MIIVHALVAKASNAGTAAAVAGGAGMVAALPLWVSDIATVVTVVLSLVTLAGVVLRGVSLMLARWEVRILETVKHEIVAPMRAEQAEQRAEVAALATQAAQLLHRVETATQTHSNE